MPDNDSQTKYIKASRRAALLSLLVFIAIAGAIVYNTMQLNSLAATITRKQAEVDLLAKQVVDLDETVANLKYAPVQKPHAYVEKLNGILDRSGNQLYDFTMWLDLAAFRNQDIKQVTYSADDPAFKEVTATVPGNGFSVNFRGTDCLKNVTVTIELTDGSSEQSEFNMCEALNW